MANGNIIKYELLLPLNGHGDIVQLFNWIKVQAYYGIGMHHVDIKISLGDFLELGTFQTLIRNGKLYYTCEIARVYLYDQVNRHRSFKNPFCRFYLQIIVLCNLFFFLHIKMSLKNYMVMNIIVTIIRFYLKKYTIVKNNVFLVTIFRNAI